MIWPLVSSVPRLQLGHRGQRPADVADTYPAQESALASVWDKQPQLEEYTDQDGFPIH